MKKSESHAVTRSPDKTEVLLKDKQKTWEACPVHRSPLASPQGNLNHRIAVGKHPVLG